MKRPTLRPALYYPYIHIRDLHWLKATLLCVPSVQRIVPMSYVPEDSAAIAEFAEFSGPNGPLLGRVSPDYGRSVRIQERLLDYLQMREADALARFSKERCPAGTPYWIHDEKFLKSLLDYLRRRGLAWPDRDGKAVGNRNWYALHPRLGSAIMTAIGLGVAADSKLDVVTASEEFHERMLRSDEASLLDALFDDDDRLTASPPTAGRLGELVIGLAGINFAALRPADIAALQESRHLPDFQRLLRDTAGSIQGGANPADYETELRQRAEEIVDAWQESSSALRRENRDALLRPAMSFGAGVLVAGDPVRSLLVSGGVEVAWQIRERLARRTMSDANSYLAQVVQSQSQILRLAFPLGLAR